MSKPDPNPLLSHREPKKRTLDDMIEHCVGEFGWTHILQATFVSLAWFFDAQQTFISVFTDAQPKWSCRNNSTSCNNNNNICQLPIEAWSWNLPPTTSIISEWSLQCAGSIITALPGSSFLFGCFSGGFVLATLADSSLGRKNMLVLSTLLMSLAGVLTAFSTNVWMYAALRFLSGFGRATVGTCSIVLSTELVGKKWREKIGIIGFICFTLGFLSLPAVAFCLRGHSWRLIYISTCVPSVVYSLLVFLLVPESPRWLFIQGRKQEFAETLRSIAAPASQSSLTQSFFVQEEEEEEEPVSQIVEVNNIFSAARMLLKKRWSCRRILAVMVVGFGNGMVYYGIPLGLGNLSFDLYVSVTLNALSEFPASILTLLLIGRVGRKGCVLGLSLLSGICSVSCVLVRWQGMQIAMELVSFFSVCAAFDVVMIYTLELFPTCVRNSAVSLVRQALVFGGALSPVLVAAGREKGLLVSYGVFGLIISVCAVSVVLLPETRGTLLCDTMEEEERKEAYRSTCSCC